MRIVSGRHRARPLAVPKGHDVRPTSDRARAAIFDILSHGKPGLNLLDATVLDAFAGSGALGFEALSRGAAHVTFMEQAPAHLFIIKDTAKSFGETDNITPVRTDATLPPRAKSPVDAVFMDPPYNLGLAPTALVALADAGWFKSGTIAVVEVAAKEEFAAPDGFELIDERKYGAAKVIFLRWG